VAVVALAAPAEEKKGDDLQGAQSIGLGYGIGLGGIGLGGLGGGLGYGGIGLGGIGLGGGLGYGGYGMTQHKDSSELNPANNNG
jgi:hypothetical protein